MTEREKVTILIVDDQPAKLLSLETVIAELGQNIVKAASAEEALRVLLAQEVAVVLVDVCMPTMDGFELAAMIRGHPRFGRTAIIFISAVHLSDADRLRGYDLGAVDYMPVPIIPEVLRAKVAVFADLHRKTEQLKRLNHELEARVAERTADLAASNARLHHEENRYRSLIANLPAAVFTIDASGYISLYNRAAAELWGREPQIGVDRYTGAQGVFTLDGTSIAPELTPIARCLREGTSIRGLELLHQRADGTFRRVLPHPDPLFDERGNIIGAINMLMDVTEQRAAENTRSHLAAIVQNSNDAIISKDLQGVIQSWNQTAERVYGYTAEEMIGRSISTVVPPDRLDEEAAIVDRIRLGERVEHFETVRMAKGGRAIDVSLTVSPIRDAAGRIVGASKIARDISEARAATRERDRLLAILEATPDLVATTNSAGRIRYMNPAGRRMAGAESLESVVGTPLSQIYPGETAKLVIETAMPTAAREGTWEGETIIAGHDGARTPVSQVIIAHTSRLGDVEVFSTIARDITERKRAEDVLARDRETLERLVAERTIDLERSNERLRLTDRMATIGTLSAGLGHDMGNLLLPVRLRLEAIEAAPLPAQIREDVSAIRSATDYLQRLARSLRMLAIDPERDAAGQTGTDLVTWWDEVEGMLRNGLQRPAVLCAKITPGLPRVSIGPAALSQIAFNLVQNAGDILRGREGGRVQLEAHTTLPGDAVRIVITDNGPGMNEETRRRCMEPFFTTKTRGLSTGLGLSLVGSLVRNAGGTIDIESSLGKGTAFAITLPVVKPSDAGPTTAAARIAGLAVIDLADPRLGALVDSVLTSLDYTTHRRATDDAQEIPSQAIVWVTHEALPAHARAVESFLSAGPHRRAVVFAANGQGASSLPASGTRAPLRLDPATRPSQLRSLIIAAVSEPLVAVAGDPR